jgi:hypothetical protein
MDGKETSLARALAIVKARELAQAQMDEGQGDKDAGSQGGPMYSMELQNYSAGTTCTHNEMAADNDDDFPQDLRMPQIIAQIFSLEQGRALKRLKKLSPESEADSEQFLHISLLLGF